MTNDDLRALVQRLRCDVTGHPCGTDTWRKGRTCKCDSCQQWLLARAEAAERERDAANEHAEEAHRKLVPEWQAMASDRDEAIERAEAAEAECARLRQDAERLQWLIDTAAPQIVAVTWRSKAACKLDSDDPRVYIDAAIAEGKQ